MGFCPIFQVRRTWGQVCCTTYRVRDVPEKSDKKGLPTPFGLLSVDNLYQFASLFDISRTEKLICTIFQVHCPTYQVRFVRHIRYVCTTFRVRFPDISGTGSQKKTININALRLFSTALNHSLTLFLTRRHRLLGLRPAGSLRPFRPTPRAYGAPTRHPQGLRPSASGLTPHRGPRRGHSKPPFPRNSKTTSSDQYRAGYALRKMAQTIQIDPKSL